MLRFAILPLLLASAFVQAGPLTLGVVLDQNESITDFDTTKRYRAFANEVGTGGWPAGPAAVLHQAFFRYQAAPRTVTLDMVFGPAQVIANIGKFKFEPVLKSDADDRCLLCRRLRTYKGTLAAKSGARLGLPDYESLMGGIARSEINSRGLAKTDFSEIKFHRMADAPLYGLEAGSLRPRRGVRRRSQDLDRRQRWPYRLHQRVRPAPRTLSVQTETVPLAAQTEAGFRPAEKQQPQARAGYRHQADFKDIASMLNTTPTSLPGAKVISAAEARDARSPKGFRSTTCGSDEDYEDSSRSWCHFRCLTMKAAPRKSSSIRQTTSSPLNNCPRIRTRRSSCSATAPSAGRATSPLSWQFKAGWKNIYWFRGGFPEWKEKRVLPIAKEKLIHLDGA